MSKLFPIAWSKESQAVLKDLNLAQLILVTMALTPVTTLKLSSKNSTISRIH